MLARTLAAALTAFLAGCSTSPVAPDRAIPVPTDRVFTPAVLSPDGTRTASVTFTRDAGFGGSACTHTLFVDGAKVFAIRKAESITVYVAPGDHTFRLESGGGICPDIVTSQDAVAKAGQHLVYRILLPSDASLRLTRMQ